MVGRSRERGDYWTINMIAGEIGSSRSTIIRAINEAEKSETPPEPPLNMQGTRLHKDELERVRMIVEENKKSRGNI